MNSHIISRIKNLSVVGSVSRAICIPFVSGLLTMVWQHTSFLVLTPEKAITTVAKLAWGREIENNQITWYSMGNLYAMSRGKRADDKNSQILLSTTVRDDGFHYYDGKLNDNTVIVYYIISDHDFLSFYQVMSLIKRRFTGYPSFSHSKQVLKVESEHLHSGIQRYSERLHSGIQRYLTLSAYNNISWLGEAKKLLNFLHRLTAHVPWKIGTLKYHPKRNVQVYYVQSYSTISSLQVKDKDKFYHFLLFGKNSI